MLIINENDRRLLNMKEKLLEVTEHNNESILDDYVKLAKDIDNNCYNQIVNKIKESDYNGLSLEEQIKFLSEIEEDYNYLNELQWMIRNTYSRYADEDIELCDINKILIDNIIERISDIHGYLMNIKNLDSNKMEVDRLNNKLILLEKEKEQIKRLINDIKSKLKNDIIGAEGRAYDAYGKIIPISINSELNKYGVSLSEVLNDSSKLIDAYEMFSQDKEILEETFKATIDLPKRDEDVCHQIELDMIKGKYKFALIELINEISLDDNEYASFKERLYKIADIINDLKDYSTKLGVRFYINPFDRIKIESQIQVINSVKNIDKEIGNIKKTITYITSMIDDANDKNKELISLINTDIKIMEDDKIDDLVEQPIHYDIKEETFGDTVLANNVQDNQVIKIGDIKEEFKIDRVHEKTEGVINRVFDMISRIPVDTQRVETPELILEPVKKEIVDGDKKEDNIFFDDMFPHFDEEVENESPTNLDNDANITVDNSDNIFLNSSEKNNEEMFQEVVPFEETPLFSDRYDSGIFEPKPKMMIDLSDDKDLNKKLEDKNNIIQFDSAKKNDPLDSMMPEAFWVTKDDDIEEEENKALSFDEQVAALINNDEQAKTKKRVA